MTGGQVFFFALVLILVLVLVATIVDSWWRGRKKVGGR